MKTMWYLTWPLWPITSLRQPGATDSLTLLLVIFSFTHVYKVYQVPFLAGDGFRFSKRLLRHLRTHKLFQKTTWKKKTSQVLGTKFGNGDWRLLFCFRQISSREELQRSLEILGCDRACLSCYMCWVRRWLDEILGSYLPRVGNEMFWRWHVYTNNTT